MKTNGAAVQGRNSKAKKLKTKEKETRKRKVSGNVQPTNSPGFVEFLA